MTAFIPMARPSGRCFGTVKDFDKLFAITSEARSSMTRLMGGCFVSKRSTRMRSTRGAARAQTRGASRGIGRTTALALAETGTHVLVHYGRSAQEAESL